MRLSLGWGIWEQDGCWSLRPRDPEARDIKPRKTKAARMAAFCLPFRTIFSLFGWTRDVVAETFDLINPSHCELDFPSGICFTVLLLLLFAIAAQVHRALPLESVGFLLHAQQTYLYFVAFLHTSLASVPRFLPNWLEEYFWTCYCNLFNQVQVMGTGRCFWELSALSWGLATREMNLYVMGATASCLRPGNM